MIVVDFCIQESRNFSPQKLFAQKDKYQGTSFSTETDHVKGLRSQGGHALAFNNMVKRSHIYRDVEERVVKVFLQQSYQTISLLHAHLKQVLQAFFRAN